jgi:ligand-binding SRPBCC domain-containing protein
MLQSKHHFWLSIKINAPIEKVWQNLIHVPTWHIWDTELVSATLNSTFTNGATGSMVPKKGPTLTYTITNVILHQAYDIEIKMPVGQLVIKRTLIQESSNQTIFTDDIAFKGIFKYIIGAILGKQFKKVLPAVLQKFKQLNEA